MAMTPVEKRIRRRVRSFAVVFTLLLLTPAFLALARRTLMPLAVRSGIADTLIHERLAAVFGASVSFDHAALPQSDVLELFDVRLAQGAAGFTEIRFGTVRIHYSGPPAEADPEAIEILDATARFDVEAWRELFGDGSEPFRVSPKVLQELSLLRWIKLHGGELTLSAGDAVDVLGDLGGTYDPVSGKIQIGGDFAGAGPDSFVLEGAVDLQSGEPTLAVKTRRKALPTGLEKMISRLLGITVRPSSEHSMNVKAGRVEDETVTVPSDELMSEAFGGEFDGDPFELHIRYDPSGAKIKGQIPYVEVLLGEREQQLIVWGRFEVERGAEGGFTGWVNLNAHLHQEDGLEEDVELELKPLRVSADGAHMEGTGVIRISDGRAVTIQMLEIVETDDGTQMALKLSAEKWDFGRSWKFPWVLGQVDPPVLSGVADIGLQATRNGDEFVLSVTVTGGAVSIEDAVMFSGAESRVAIGRRDGELSVDATIALVEPRSPGRPAKPGTRARATLKMRGRGFAGPLRGTGRVTLHMDDGEPWSFDLSRVSLPDGFSRLEAEGTLHTPAGFTATLSKLKWGPHLELEARLTEADLGRVGAEIFALMELPVPEMSGVVNAELSVTEGPAETQLHLKVRSSNGARIDVGGSSVAFREATLDSSTKKGEVHHRLTLSNAEVTLGRVTATTDDLKASLNLGAAGPLGERKVTASVRLNGAYLYRGARDVDTKGRAVVIAGRGIWFGEERTLVDAAGSIEVEGWARAEVTGRARMAGEELYHDLTFEVKDAPLQSVLEGLSLVLDRGGIDVRGTISGHVHSQQDEAGYSLAGEIARVDVSRLNWEDWKFRQVALRRLPLSFGVPRRGGHQESRSGELSIRVVQFPGGEATRLKFGFTAERAPGRDGALRLRATETLVGAFCGGRVEVEGVDVRLRLGSGSHARVAVKVENLDLRQLSELVGMPQPLTGNYSGRFNVVRVSEKRIEFEGGSLRGTGPFSGTWAVNHIMIEDPFGPDSSYAVKLRYKEINLRHVSSYLIDSATTRHGVIHGRASGFFNFKVLHNGELEEFKVYTRVVHKSDVRQYINKDAARKLIRTFGPKGVKVAKEMKRYPNNRIPYDRLAFFAQMGADLKVRLRGGIYRLPPNYEWREYTEDDLLNGVEKTKDLEYIMVARLKAAHISREMYDEPIDWKTLREHATGKAPPPN